MWAKAMKPEHAQGVSRIRKLQIQGAPGAQLGVVQSPGSAEHIFFGGLNQLGVETTNTDAHLDLALLELYGRVRPGIAVECIPLAPLVGNAATLGCEL